MAQPERLEDLGRIREKVESLLHGCEAMEAASMHDEYFLKFYNNNEDRLDDLFRSLRYVRDTLYDCAMIAKGRDDE